jgi:hypothetical protein
MNEADLREHLAALTPGARDELRKLLIADLERRNRASEQLLRRKTPGTRDLAGLLDILSLDADARRQAVRLLGELQASG